MEGSKFATYDPPDPERKLRPTDPHADLEALACEQGVEPTDEFVVAHNGSLTSPTRISPSWSASICSPLVNSLRSSSTPPNRSRKSRRAGGSRLEVAVVTNPIPSSSLYLCRHEPPDGEEIGPLMKVFGQSLEKVLRRSH